MVGAVHGDGTLAWHVAERVGDKFEVVCILSYLKTGEVTDEADIA